MELKYLFDKDSNFQKKLDEVYKATGDLTIPLTLIAREWFKGNRSIFKLKGPGRYKDLSTKPFTAWWEPKGSPLNTTYLNGYRSYKAAKYGSAYPILKATGRLEKSITDGNSSESVNQVLPDKKTLRLGTRVPYGIYHQSDAPRSKMPYRPFLFAGVEQIAPNDIKNNRVKAWTKILENHFTQVMNNK